MWEFDARPFVDAQIGEIRRVIGEGKAVIAVSKGVDTSTMSHLYVDMYAICGLTKAAMDILCLYSGHVRLPLTDMAMRTRRPLER